MTVKGVMATPRTVNIAITGRCNLSCRYCFYADDMAARRDLDTRSWLAFFGELGSLGVMDVCLSGGEPLARPDFLELVDGILANRMRYSVLTNGTLVDERLVSELGAGKRRPRMDYIQVSVDGSCPEVHDRSRPGSFGRTVRGIRLLRAAGLPVTARVTVSRHNLHDLEATARLLLEELGLPAMSTNEAVPMAAGCENRGELALSAPEQRLAMDTLAALQARYPGRLLAQAGPQAKRRMYAEMEHARETGEKTRRWKMGYLSSCGCVLSMVDVMHDGAIVPCHVLHGHVLGWVGRDSLQEIWLHHPVLGALRARRDIPMSEVAGCEGCPWGPFCSGGCPGLACELTGDFNRANPEDCYRSYLSRLGGRDAG